MYQEENAIEYFKIQTDILCDVTFKFITQFKEFQDGIAFDYFGRCFSSFNSIRTILITWDKFQKQSNFTDEYKEIIKDILTQNITEEQKTELIGSYIGSLYVDLRFLFFHSFFSQTEFTLKEIIRNQFPQENKKSQPFIVMKREFGVFDVDFIDFVLAIRNTIHNNGYYFPNDKTKEDFSYNFSGKTFEFIKGQTIKEVSLDDLFNIVEKILNDCFELFMKNSSLKKIRKL